MIFKSLLDKVSRGQNLQRTKRRMLVVCMASSLVPLVIFKENAAILVRHPQFPTMINDDRKRHFYPFDQHPEYSLGTVCYFYSLVHSPGRGSGQT